VGALKLRSMELADGIDAVPFSPEDRLGPSSGSSNTGYEPPAKRRAPVRTQRLIYSCELSGDESDVCNAEISQCLSSYARRATFKSPSTQAEIKQADHSAHLASPLSRPLLQLETPGNTPLPGAMPHARLKRRVGAMLMGCEASSTPSHPAVPLSSPVAPLPSPVARSDVRDAAVRRRHSSPLRASPLRDMQLRDTQLRDCSPSRLIESSPLRQKSHTPRTPQTPASPSPRELRSAPGVSRRGPSVSPSPSRRGTSPMRPPPSVVIATRPSPTMRSSPR